MDHKRIEFKSVTYPEISLQNFCTCGNDDCGKDVQVAIEIIAEIPKEKLAAFIDILTDRSGYDYEDLPVNVTIEPVKQSGQIKLYKDDHDE